MSRSALKSYQSMVRKEMSGEVISEVSRKIPGWFNRIFGWGVDFVATDKKGKVWHVSVSGDCYCEETGETI